MRYFYKGTDRLIIERSSASSGPQVVARALEEVCPEFMAHVLTELDRVEFERERMAVIVRGQAKEMARLRRELDEITD